MKKSITIRIPEPCHEDWAKMTSTEKGKFCSVCTKEVFDFTTKTDEELVKILSKNKTVCGRVITSQLNREVKLERKSGQSFAPFAASMLLPLTLFSNNPKSSTDSISEKPMISLGISRFSNPDNLRMYIITKGIVRDENGDPIKNVKIISNETEAQTWTNKKGEYEIYTLDKEILTFIKENYGTQQVRLRKKAIENVLMESEIGSRTVVVTTDTHAFVTSGMIAVESNTEVEKDSIIATIKGNVTDDTGLALPGANVIIKGTTIGTQTDFDGNYEVKTKPGDILLFSYVGFETREVTVSNISNTIDVSLDNGDFILGEIAVGGISWEYVEESQPHKDKAWREKVKQASENGRMFYKMKWEREKSK
ncbi:hypothetical protein Aeqsu_2466 [Aequorivita sublithincola DSM 14238]|uniref:TonB-linked outer membrane protein, SusC/RagA family n=1 Tax=Aequorivita sublithincola (strain DSM 14238 / LMG 21431 / ACAM 643 / 9-3) TaxID=746697 RepID=I3YY56_AEQSU|nr:carboxypeptidase-like regulatory domain-containing protein [Aequorivita sublithincola]AFL81924.1 hypothetical protein Aeqsu_2466 [Aequorivita sublithincola DSM 14238]